MEDIYNLSKSLGEKISSSECYMKYTYYKSKIDENKELKAKIQLFKKKQFDIESQKAQGIKIDDMEERALEDEYFQFSTDQICLSFFQYEREIIKILSDVYECIGNNVKIDIDFLDK